MKFHPKLCVYQVVTYRLLGYACQDCETGAVPLASAAPTYPNKTTQLRYRTGVCPTGWGPVVPKEIMTSLKYYGCQPHICLHRECMDK